MDKLNTHALTSIDDIDLIKFNFTDSNGNPAEIGVGDIEKLFQTVSELENFPSNTDKFTHARREARNYAEACAIKVFNKIFKLLAEDKKTSEISLSTERKDLHEITQYFNYFLNLKSTDYSEIVKFCEKHGLVFVKATALRDNKWNENIKLNFDTVEISDATKRNVNMNIYAICKVEDVKVEALCNLDDDFSFCNSKMEYLSIIKMFYPLLKKASAYERDHIEKKLATVCSQKGSCSDFKPIYLHTHMMKKLPSIECKETCKNVIFKIIE